MSSPQNQDQNPQNSRNPRIPPQTLAWTLPPEPDPERERSTVIPIALLFAGFGFPVQQISGFPIPELFGGLAVLYGLTQPSVRRLPSWVLPICVAILGLMVMSGQLNQEMNTRRLAHIALWCALVLFLGSGRIHHVSAARGLIVGMAAGIALSLAGYKGGNYDGRLTGTFGDPNNGGYYQLVLGALAVAYLSHRVWIQRGFLLMTLVAIYRTLSRTTSLGAVFGITWALIGRRLGRVGGVLMVIALVLLADHFQGENAADVGPFGDRAGSDALRARIIAQEKIQVAAAPWYGNGPGTSKVQVQGNPFFFHSSYLAARNEGGWPLVILLVGLLVLTFLALFNVSESVKQLAALHQVSLIGVAVCSVSLGEVLLELPTAVAVGISLAFAGSHPPDPPPDQATDPTPAPGG